METNGNGGGSMNKLFYIFILFYSSMAFSTNFTLIDVDNLRFDVNTISSTNANGNITLDPNGSGLVDYVGTNFRMGLGTDVDLTITANRNTFDPYIQYDSTLSKWVFSNDGSTESAFAATALDNLSSVQINSDLLFDTNNTYDVGDSTKNVSEVHARQVISNDTLQLKGGSGAGVEISSGSEDVALLSTGGTLAPTLSFYDKDNGFSANLKAPDTLSASYVLTLPADDGDEDDVLSTDGDGNLSWVPNGSGGAPEAQLWSGYHSNADCAFSRTNTAYGDFAADSTCTFTEIKNVNFGTVTSALSGSDKLPGIVFTPAQAGTYYVCYSGAIAGGTANARVFLALLDSSGVVIDECLHRQVSGSIETCKLCGFSTASDTSPQTIKVQGKADSGAVNTGGTEIRESWSIFFVGAD